MQKLLQFSLDFGSVRAYNESHIKWDGKCFRTDDGHNLMNGGKLNADLWPDHDPDQRQYCAGSFAVLYGGESELP